MENAHPDFVRRILKEWIDIKTNPIEGIQMIYNEQDMTDLQAIIDGPVSTPYHKGKFRVRLVIPESYPVEPPKAYFNTKILHPNIAPTTGEVCVNTLKMDWKSNLGLRHILMIIRCLLVHPNPESALNEEAGKMILEDYNEYAAQAKLLTEVHACRHLWEQSSIADKPENISKGSLDVTGNQSVPKVNRVVCPTRKALKRL